ncbi:MAG: hypothetical protein MZU95_05000 [Desulfomicrobium escambiense]|nr:hypothetical protein [Desulfomicrobium escambiense]
MDQRRHGRLRQPVSLRIACLSQPYNYPHEKEKKLPSRSQVTGMGLHDSLKPHFPECFPPGRTQGTGRAMACISVQQSSNSAAAVYVIKTADAEEIGEWCGIPVHAAFVLMVQEVTDPLPEVQTLYGQKIVDYHENRYVFPRSSVRGISMSDHEAFE